MKHLFIINPSAGKGKTLKLIPFIQSLFKNCDQEFFIEVTQKSGHATSIVREYVNKETYRVYSVGGDGTLNEVLNGIVGSRSSLAVIPGGSGNDFYRSIGKEIDMEIALQKSLQGVEKQIDIGKVNDRYFINISSMGFDAAVVYHTRLIKKLPWIPGSLSYTLGILVTVLKNQSYALTFMLEDQRIEGNYLLSAIANGRYYGGGMIPVPTASFEDGLLDVCIVEKANRRKVLSLFPRYKKGQHGGLKEVSFYQSRRIQIEAKEAVPLNVDGEVDMVQSALFEIIPNGITLVVPKA